jgi:DNA uptake protein ComE-like DNA-binding protein
MKRPYEYEARFSKGERRGLFILLILFLCIYAAKSVLEWRTQNTNSSPVVAAAPMENLELPLSNSKPAEFPFDPNTVSDLDMARLGLPEKTIKTILKYRSKGGVFRTPDDFKKMYTLKSEDFARLKPFIAFKSRTAIPKTEKKKVSPSYFSPSDWRDSLFDPNQMKASTLKKMGFGEKVSERWEKYVQKGGRFKKPSDLKKLYGVDTALLMTWSANWVFLKDERDTVAKKMPERMRHEEIPEIDINLATEPEWEYLPGIGPSFARRIVAYRHKLGGFYSIDQVGETYGLPDTVFQKIRPSLRWKSPPEKIQINTISADALSKHPYFPFRKANLLCNYRNHHGPYLELADLYKIQVLDSAWIKKIAPYLDYSREQPEVIRKD